MAINKKIIVLLILLTIIISVAIVIVYSIANHVPFYIRPISFVSADWSKISCGHGYTMAIKPNGALWAWGSNAFGEIGIHRSLRFGRLVPPIEISIGDWADVACGDCDTVAIKSDGTLWFWGVSSSNDIIQMGTDNDWGPIACGGGYGVAIKKDGTLWAWGNNLCGQLGLGDTISRTLPAQAGKDADWDTVVCGSKHTVALKKDGTLWAWGSGQLGLGNTVSSTLPAQVGKDTNWAFVACGDDYTMALKKDGTLWAWGSNEHGQLGLGDTISRTLPAQAGKDADWDTVACGYQHTVAIKKDGTLWAWGSNEHGQLGLKNTAIIRMFAVVHIYSFIYPTANQIGEDTDWDTVACGFMHTVALKKDGTLWAWGSNDIGQLGLKKN